MIISLLGWKFCDIFFKLGLEVVGVVLVVLVGVVIFLWWVRSFLKYLGLRMLILVRRSLCWMRVEFV